MERFWIGKAGGILKFSGDVELAVIYMSSELIRKICAIVRHFLIVII